MRPMTAALLLSLTLLGVLTLSNGLRTPPHVFIDLDAAPQTRWAGAVATSLSVTPFEKGFGPIFALYNASLFDNLSARNFTFLATVLKSRFPEHYAELQGVSQAFTKGGHYVSVEYLSAWVLSHELGHSTAQNMSVLRASQKPPHEVDHLGCTGVLVATDSGSVIHGRNMDQVPEEARDITLHITFQRSGRTLFEATDWYWFTTGVMTAVKSGVASVQENWRFSKTPISTASIFSCLRGSCYPQVFVFRHALSQPNMSTFDAMVSYVNTIPLAAPMYAVVGGVERGQGAIVTRAVDQLTKPIFLNTSSTFYLVQTNYDHWLPDPPSDPRRTVAEQTLGAIGLAEASSHMGVFGVMSEYPVHNPDTLYTAVMQASASPPLHVFVRDPITRAK